MQNKTIFWKKYWGRTGLIISISCFFIVGFFRFYGLFNDTYIDFDFHDASGPAEIFQDEKVAFVFGALGAYSQGEHFKCLAAMESLTKIAGFSGNIYLLTDNSKCFVNEERVKELTGNNMSHLIVIKESISSFSNGNRRSLIHDTGTVNYQWNMRLKTEMLNYINTTNLELVVWYDCDVIFSKKNCFKEMMNEKPEIKEKSAPIWISRPGHVGMVAVNPSVSGDALHQWYLLLDAARKEKKAVHDYQAFLALFDHPNATMNSRIVPRPWEDHFLEPGENPTRFCVNHISNGRCKSLGASFIQKFAQSLHLNSVSGRSYCGSSLRVIMKKRAWDKVTCEYPWWM